jgi:hypothetical protein
MFTVGGIAFGWGLDSIKAVATGGGSGGLSQSDVDAYLNLSKKADDLQQSSIDKLSSILLNKETLAEIERRKKAAQSIMDPKEKEAALANIMVDEEASLRKAADAKDTQQKIAKLDENQKKLAGAATSNLFLSALTNKASLDVATGIVQKAQSNPASAVAYATQLPRIKDAVVSLPGKIDKTYTLTNKLISLNKTNNIEVVMPKSASDKPKDVTAGI